MFCAYAVVAVIFTYVYQLTFFAGIMVLTCRREIEGRHCLTFHMIKKDPPAKISNRKAGRILKILLLKLLFLQFRYHRTTFKILVR